MKSTIEFLNGIKLEALLLMNNQGSSHIGEALLVQADIDDLAEEYSAGCGHLVSPDDCDRAKRDIGYLLTLVDADLDQYRREGGEG
jgi:hypothetical protein